MLTASAWLPLPCEFSNVMASAKKFRAEMLTLAEPKVPIFLPTGIKRVGAVVESKNRLRGLLAFQFYGSVPCRDRDLLLVNAGFDVDEKQLLSAGWRGVDSFLHGFEVAASVRRNDRVGFTGA